MRSMPSLASKKAPRPSGNRRMGSESTYSQTLSLKPFSKTLEVGEYKMAVNRLFCYQSSIKTSKCPHLNPCR